MDWQEQLADSIRRAVGAVGVDEVRDAVDALLLDETPGGSTPLTPPVAVLGVDGCKAGWVGVLVRPEGPTSLHVASKVVAMVEQIRGEIELGVVAIDIPIGLPDSSVRAADRLVRAELGGKASSVFVTAPRQAYLAADYAAARTVSVAVSDSGTSLSAQAWGLAPKILEVDEWVRSRPSVAVIEAHPELSFARLNGEPVYVKKKTAEGAAVRRGLLHRAGLTVPSLYPGMGVAEDDLLDACAAAWTAVRYAEGRAESFPSPPERFSDGIAAAIWV